MQGQFMVITVEEQSHLALQALTDAAGVRKKKKKTIPQDCFLDCGPRFVYVNDFQATVSQL